MPMVMDTHTEPTDMDMDTHTDMVTTERDLLMLSQRLMLMPLSCTEPTDMVPTHMLEPTVPTHMPMELTHIPMVQIRIPICLRSLRKVNCSSVESIKLLQTKSSIVFFHSVSNVG